MFASIQTVVEDESLTRRLRRGWLSSDCKIHQLPAAPLPSLLFTPYGSVGDSYDDALTETINGLYKAEVIHRRGRWRNFEAVEFATLEWGCGSTTGVCFS